MGRPIGQGTVLKLALALAASCCALAAPAATAAVPIPEGPDAATLPAFIGSPATPHPVKGTTVPQNPFMAPNGRSNLHDDAYMTDSYEQSGPLGHGITRTSTLLGRECASTAFDAQGRIVTVCVGLDGPQLQLLDPRTLDTLAVFPLPPRIPSGGSPFTDFSGGGYFYLDNQGRAVIPTTTGHIWVVGESATGFSLVHDYDISSAVPVGDKIESALPDWSGRIWFVSAKGVVGYVNPSTGAVRSLDTGETIGNSFATDETGGVYVVTDAALYRFAVGSTGAPIVTWRSPYANDGTSKPGQTEVGSGTTPTITGRYVAITDNADPIDAVVYKRASGGPVCAQPVFRKGQSDTDQSLVAAGNSLVVENNYGYSSPLATENGGSTAPGLERVDIDQNGTGCHSVWQSNERAPSVVPKVSLGAGLVYTYTKDQRSDGKDAWYFTALDFRDGHTVYKRLAGEGLGFNNNYAPVTLGPDGTAYVGVLGGLVELRDAAG
ncbi:MAG TPA: hypothetical protein VGF74_17340 [Thermoleophilaceae bacterium]